ncbi:MAG: hypothetical protein GZ091_01230 [Paludibacter sp.]|nr:hypothetical protein [Paludibacter sp.]
MNSLKTVFFIIVISFFFISCKKPSPQLPSNKVIENDDNGISLLEINQNLAMKEDSLLQIYALKTDKSFKKNEIGFWYKIDNKTNGKQIRINDTCVISFKLRFIDGKVVQEETKGITVGKKELVTGLEEGLKLLRKGESATFIIPWYLGYGMTGLENVIPPYTSLIFDVSIKD